MAKQSFVGSLAYATTDDSLNAFFATVGPVVSARVITDRDSGRSKGFGFVEFENEDDNQKLSTSLTAKSLTAELSLSALLVQRKIAHAAVTLAATTTATHSVSVAGKCSEIKTIATIMAAIVFCYLS